MAEKNTWVAMPRTIGLGHLLQRAEISPYKVFREYPLADVRKKCLERLKAERLDDVLADWLESAIIDLLKVNDQMWEELLSTYIFRVDINVHEPSYQKYIFRAVQFLVNLSKLNPETMDNKISKILGGLMKPGEFSPLRFYKDMVFVQRYMAELLMLIDKEAYSESSWNCARRALDIIVATCDFSFLEQLEKLFERYKNNYIYPDRNSCRYDAYQTHLATINVVVGVLREAKRESVH